MKISFSWLKQPSLYLMLVLVALLSIFPFYWMYVIGSSTNAAIASIPPTVVPGNNWDATFSHILEQFDLWNVYKNSFIVSIVVAVVQVFTSTLAGFAFAKLRFRGNKFLFGLVMVFLMIPVQLGIIPLYLLMANLGLVDTLLALILPYLVSVFGVFWMRQAMVSNVPQELIDAGAIDGAGFFRVYRSVALPMVRSAAFVLALFTFLTTWNDFAWPLIITQTPENFTAQVAVSQLNAANNPSYPAILGGSLVMALPLIVMFVITAKQFVAGVMDGAVKG
jgi:cellobiose transport system permease protein